MQIFNNVYQVLGGMYGNIANIYCIQGKDGLILIDSGETLEDYQMVMDNLKAWRLTDPIQYVILTHEHFNHVANAYRFQKNGSKIIAPALEVDTIEGRDINAIIDYSPFPPKPDYHPVKVDIPVNDQDVLELCGITFKVIHAPGHTKGSMILETTIDNKVVWFTGDVLSVGNEGRSINLGWNGGSDYNANDYLKTIFKLSKMHCDVLLPGHMQACMQNCDVLLQKFIAVGLTALRSPANK